MIASGSFENSRSRTGRPLFSVLLRKKRTAPPEDVAGVDRRLPLRVRGGAVSDEFFESGGSVIAASSLFTLFLQKPALLEKVGVAFSNHLVLGEFRDKQAARI